MALAEVVPMDDHRPQSDKKTRKKAWKARRAEQREELSYDASQAGGMPLLEAKADYTPAVVDESGHLLLAEGTVATLAAPPKSGKSWAALALARAAHTVVWVAYERPGSTARRALAAGVDPERFLLLDGRKFKPRVEERRDEEYGHMIPEVPGTADHAFNWKDVLRCIDFTRAVERDGGMPGDPVPEGHLWPLEGLVVIDSATSAGCPTDGGNIEPWWDKVVRPWSNPIDSWAVLLLDHTPRGDPGRAIGSITKAALTDVTYRLRADRSGGRITRMVMEPVEANDEASHPEHGIEIVLKDSVPTAIAAGVGAAEALPTMDELAAFEAVRDEGMAVSVAASAAGLRRSTFRDHYSRWEDSR